MKKNTVAAIIATILAFAATLGGCFDGKAGKVVNVDDGKPEITVKLSFFGNKYEAENVVVIEQMLNDYMRENPHVKITYESLKGNAYYDVLKKRLRTGNGNDIFMVNHDIVLEFYPAGDLADLSDLPVMSAYTRQVYGQMNDRGKVYFAPTSISAFGLYCNLDLLKKYNQPVPKTIDEWRRACDFFVSQGITPIIANNDISLKTLAIARGMYPLYQEDGQEEFFDAVNRGDLGLSRYLAPGFALVQEFREKGYVNAAQALTMKKTSEDLEEFARGESPFMLTGVWAARRVKAMAKNLNFAAYPYPVMEDGAVLVTNVDTRISVNAHSPQVDEAKKFVAYITQQERMIKFASNQCSFLPIKGGAIEAEPEIMPIQEALLTDRTMLGADNFLEVPLWDLTRDCSVKVLRGEDAKDVMDWLDKKVASGYWR